jgi:hypothetical protein
MLAILNENYPKMRNIQSLNEVDSTIDFILDILGIKNLDDDFNEHNRKFRFICEFIISEFGFLTIPEIKEAFKMYVAKKFGHKDIFRILDVIVISEVLNCFVEYRSDTLRIHTQKAQKLALQEENKLSDSEIDKQMIEAVNNRYLEFIESNTISEPLEHIFKELIERKILKMPSAEFPKLYEYYDNKLLEAKKQIKEELNSQVSITKKEKEQVQEQLKLLSESNSSKVEIRAKKLVLIEFFAKQKSLGKTKII